MKYAIVGIVVIIAAGCASTPPPCYYTLDMTPSGRVGAPIALDVKNLRPAEPLNRGQILIQAGPTRVEYYATEQWIAGLGDLVAEKLEAEFADPGQAERVFQVEGEITHFEQVDAPPGAEIYVRAELEFCEMFEDGAVGPVFARRYIVRAPAQAPNADAVVEALSEACEELAARMAADLKSAPAREGQS